MSESLPRGAAPPPGTPSPALCASDATVEDDPDPFLVLVFDPQTDETDAYGPLSGWIAVEEAVRRQEEFVAEGLEDVVVRVVPVHSPVRDSLDARRGPMGMADHGPSRDALRRNVGSGRTSRPDGVAGSPPGAASTRSSADTETFRPCLFQDPPGWLAMSRHQELHLRQLRRGVAAQVVKRAEYWIRDGLPPDAALALVQNAVPLVVGAGGSELQSRSHARVLVALLLLVDAPDAADLATDLIEMQTERPSV